MDSTSEDLKSSNMANTAAQNSQTASDYIDEQLALEADAKEILPYKFDKCTYILGPLRQSVFACLTCSPPPASPAQVWTPAGVCYACSISCHGEHTLVELFKRRNFVCDCGTTRFSSSPCTLRSDPTTNQRGVVSQEAAKSNTYNHNYQNKFCGCNEEYDPDTEKGTMYQCVGLGSELSGGCGEDWWHPECLMGLPRDWLEKGLANPRPQKIDPAEPEIELDHPVPEGFPHDDTFSILICYKCIDTNPWLKQYAGTNGFLPPVFNNHTQSEWNSTVHPVTAAPNLKRKASDDDQPPRSSSPPKRQREEEQTKESRPSSLVGQPNIVTLEAENATLLPEPQDHQTNIASLPSSKAISTLISATASDPKHASLPLSPPSGAFSLLATSNFRASICHCPQCFPNLIPHPQLQEEEDEYEPSISDTERSIIDGGGSGSIGTGSLLDRGEAALSNVDRVRAIEGVMVYNHLKDKVKEFLKPFAESGQAVSADDIKGYFERLRGDEEAVREAAAKPVNGSGNGGRREQRGY